ncbi:heterokaryon incompatibility protein-domain-containing protein, partial [Coniella lustricola]
MRLINTTTLELEEFASPDAHPYAILSHTWEEEEVTFQIWSHADREVRQRRKGFAKIARACKIAREKGLQYAWVDACCINKESSAELTEAINSMFTWYQKATACLVYLSDFPPHTPEFPDPLLPHCRWFTRGWTLQELIGPTSLTFYDRDWNDHGSKRLRSFEISTITGIDVAVLEASSLLKSIPVGRKMSWAAGRQTTREEDIAYCLLGIFDVNMSLIYGEGSKAFARLQEEIMKKTNDMTLFAWTSQPEEASTSLPKAQQTGQTYRGILARSPAEFATCRRVIMDHSLQLNMEFTVTNSGVRI